MYETYSTVSFQKKYQSCTCLRRTARSIIRQFFVRSRADLISGIEVEVRANAKQNNTFALIQPDQPGPSYLQSVHKSQEIERIHSE